MNLELRIWLFTMIDTEEQHQKALIGRTRTNGGILPDDNVRVYVPLDLNAD